MVSTRPSHGYGEWQSLADRAAVDFKAGKEGPIILIGHSLGADAVMEMAAYLGRKGVPVALVVPFDGTQSFAASDNVARVLNLTQRDYAYMRRGPGFHGTLANVDVSSDPNIDHLNIDKSPRLHARVVSRSPRRRWRPSRGGARRGEADGFEWDCASRSGRRQRGQAGGAAHGHTPAGNSGQKRKRRRCWHRDARCRWHADHCSSRADRHAAERR